MADPRGDLPTANGDVRHGVRITSTMAAALLFPFMEASKPVMK
jgi:hypothetical protein